VDNLWATKSEDVGLIDRAVSFQDFQPMWSWSTNVTDGQTEDMRSQDRTLHYSASCGKIQVQVSVQSAAGKCRIVAGSYGSFTPDVSRRGALRCCAAPHDTATHHPVWTNL